MTVMKATDLLRALDTHANRPAADAVPKGALYPCSDHNVVYQSDGSTWEDWNPFGTSIEHEVLMIAISDESTAITTGTAKVTFRMPFAMDLTEVRASLTTASSSGNPTFDINEGGSTILSTKLSVDSGEKTSTTAATPAVISDSALADDAEITIDIDTAGTDAAGAKIYLIGTRT